jgi:hypothetical protein
MIPELRDILFLDIETVANTHEYESLDERIKTQWARKALFFKKDREQTDEDIYHERAGIYAEFGKIICIAVGKFIETKQVNWHLRRRHTMATMRHRSFASLKICSKKWMPTISNYARTTEEI